ncbi:Altered inheritance of mitochondria protein 6 [Conoideocrella luteorostrata]|uniref:Altered inheritance of mitochondria protein 6 n=1 Tax=Conoideocrella luteorostrata TaxID=1105319 RepID=A0AAJ0FPV5_9HYPO|nr:Altered inheritance of mitochondria protein 6 [Conoideocrella luteorostrata]
MAGRPDGKAVEGEKELNNETAARHLERRKSESNKYEFLCARSLLLWLIASSGTGITIGVILVITWVAQPKAMRSAQSHNFISINPIPTNKPTPELYVGDYSRSVIPVPVHSHNDYWRPHPLYSALAAGCMSVEADVWLAPDKNDLLVGHHRPKLSENRTLQSLYINPMRQILDKLNSANDSANSNTDEGLSGIYPTSPETTLVLLIDVKGNGTEIWPLVDKQLQPLRERGYLSTLQYNSTSNSTSKPVFRQGPITVVGSGNLGRSNITGVGCDALTRYPDTFFDAPLGALADDSNFGTLPGCQADSLLGRPVAKFYTASAPFQLEVGTVLASFSAGQRAKVRAALQAAKAKNLTSRYWGTPSWPISKRDYIWQELVAEGVGLLNADDIESATRLEWNRAYKAELVWIGVSSAYIFVASLVFAYLYDRSTKSKTKKSKRKQDKEGA